MDCSPSRLTPDLAVYLETRSNRRLGLKLAVLPAINVAQRIREIENQELRVTRSVATQSQSFSRLNSYLRSRRDRSAENTLSMFGAAFADRDARGTSQRKSTALTIVPFPRSNAPLLPGDV